MYYIYYTILYHNMILVSCLSEIVFQPTFCSSYAVDVPKIIANRRFLLSTKVLFFPLFLFSFYFTLLFLSFKFMICFNLYYIYIYIFSLKSEVSIISSTTEKTTESLPKSVGGGVFRKEMKNKTDRNASKRDDQLEASSSMISIHKIKISGYIFHSA